MTKHLILPDMKIIQVDWYTGEIVEKGVLSKEHSFDFWVESYRKINEELLKLGINKVWMIAP